MKYVLFVCNHNAGRSQMAEAFFTRHALTASRRVQDLIVDRLAAIRTDRTAHQMRLVRLVPPLVREFGDHHADAEIRACADAVLSQYAEAPVRSFAMTLAHRRTRECLQRERCDLIPA
jgi:hypothetical protein